MFDGCIPSNKLASTTVNGTGGVLSFSNGCVALMVDACMDSHRLTEVDGCLKRPKLVVVFFDENMVNMVNLE